RMLLSAKELVDANRGALAISNAIDDKTWTKDAIATSEDAGSRGHQSLRIDGDQAARGNLDAVFLLEEVELWSLADGHDDGVALNQRLTAIVESGIEALVLVE